MGLHFIFGHAGCGKTTTCCQQIADYLLQNKENHAIFLVPDQGTYKAESTLASIMPQKGFTNATVSGFSRLSYRIFQELHTKTSEALPPIGQQLVISRLLSEYKDEFKVIGHAAGKKHFSENITSFFHELDTYLITEEKLEEITHIEGSSPLGLKLQDMLLLYKLYQKYLSDHFAYNGSTYDLLLQEIPKSGIISDSKIWIDGFNGMTPQEVEIVYALITHAKEVTISLTMDTPNASQNIPVWNRPYRLFSLLNKKFPNSSQTILSNNYRFKTPDITEMVNHFFTTPFVSASLPCVTKKQPFYGIKLFSAPDSQQETDEIARQIITLVKQGSHRYRDILILLRHPENYIDVLTRRFNHYHIPAFFDRKEPMNNHPLIILLSSLLRFLTAETDGLYKGWTRNNIFRILKNDLLSLLTPQEINILEIFTLRYGIRPNQWHTPWKFHTAHSVDTDTDELTEEELKEQIVMNEFRNKILTSLVPLTMHWKKSTSSKQKCSILYDWLIKQQIPEKLAAWDEKEFQETQQRPHAQVWKKVITVLEEIVHVSENDNIPSETFLTIVEDAFSTLSYSMIPSTLDHVMVTSIERGYSMEGKVVFIPGINEEQFPARIEDSGFITDIEKQQIRKKTGTSLGPDLMHLIYQEQFYVYLAMTRAKECLFLSYTSFNTEGKESSPSFLIRNLKRLGYIQEEMFSTPPTPNTTDLSYLAHPNQALSLFPSILRQGIPSENSIWVPFRDWIMSNNNRKKCLHTYMSAFSYSNQAVPLGSELANKLFAPKGHFIGSISQFESYRKCPYQYFLQRGLHLESVDQAELDARDFGNYLHAGLNNFGKELSQSIKQWRDATDEDIESLSITISNTIAPRIKYGILHSDAAQKYTKRLLNETFKQTLYRLRNWSMHSSFDTVQLEQQFYMNLVDESGKLFALTGKIDRIDQSENAIVIADYKTGNVSADLQSMLTGYHLQLIVYLMAALEKDKEHLLPAALVYIYLSGDALISKSIPPNEDYIANNNNQYINGYFLHDVNTLAELDHSFNSDNISTPYLPLTKLNSGGVKKSHKLLSKEEFNTLIIKVKEVLGKIHHKISEGQIPIQPAIYNHKNPCNYCIYRSICRFDRKLGDKPEWIPNKTDAKIKEELTNHKSGGECNE